MPEAHVGSPIPILPNEAQPFNAVSTAAPANHTPINTLQHSTHITQKTRAYIDEATKTILQNSNDEVEELLSNTGAASKEEHMNLMVGEESHIYQQAMLLPDKAKWE